MSQDIAQETFMAAAKGIGTFKSSGHQGSFRKWLWTIARNKLVDYHRKQNPLLAATGGSSALHRMALLPADELSFMDEPSSPDMLAKLTSRAMEYVKTEFREASWQAFWLTAVEGMTTDVVAKRLGMTVAAVRQSRSRIMRRLRTELGDVVLGE
jgi:RNA polymerase sigma-70 factor, ECF subfamily